MNKNISLSSNWQVDTINCKGGFYPRPYNKILTSFLTAKLRSVVTRHALSLQNKHILITVTDNTRPCPDKLILNILLKYLISKGVDKKKINILIANGLHREMTKAEMLKKYGKAACGLKIKNHNACGALEKFGSSGKTPVVLNSAVSRADIIFSIGLIEPHHYAGFSGGAKSIGVGIAGEDLINYTHSYGFITRKNVCLGSLKNNPFQKILWDVIKKIKKDFNYINVVMRARRVIDCSAGSKFEDYYNFIKNNLNYFAHSCGKKYDVVFLDVTGGKGTNFYQASRALTYLGLTNDGIIKKGGFLVLRADMDEGFGAGAGEKRFEHILSKSKNTNDLIKNVKSAKCGAPHRTAQGGGAQRAVLCAQVFKQYKIIVVGAKSDLNILKKFGVKMFDRQNEAVKYIVGAYGNTPLRNKKIDSIIITEPFEKIYVSA